MATRVRGIRVDDELWARYSAACEARGSDASAEARAFFERLARRHEAQLEKADAQ